VAEFADSFSQFVLIRIKRPKRIDFQQDSGGNMPQVHASGSQSLRACFENAPERGVYAASAPKTGKAEAA